MTYPIVTKTVEVRGIVLPWKRVELYGPYTMYDGRRANHPPKGTVLDSGEVFVPLSLLEEVSERTSDDYLMGNVPTWNLDYHQELALVEAGLAEKETRGSIHGTEKLRDFLAQAFS